MPQSLELLRPPAHAQAQQQPAAATAGRRWPRPRPAARGSCSGASSRPVPISIRSVRAAIGRRHRHQRRHVAVIDEVVLGQPHRVESQPLRLDRQLDRLAVEVGVAARVAGRPLAGDESVAELHGAMLPTVRSRRCLCSAHDAVPPGGRSPDARRSGHDRVLRRMGGCGGGGVQRRGPRRGRRRADGHVRPGRDLRLPLTASRAGRAGRPAVGSALAGAGDPPRARRRPRPADLLRRRARPALAGAGVRRGRAGRIAGRCPVGQPRRGARSGRAHHAGAGDGNGLAGWPARPTHAARPRRPAAGAVGRAVGAGDGGQRVRHPRHRILRAGAALRQHRLHRRQHRAAGAARPPPRGRPADGRPARRGARAASPLRRGRGQRRHAAPDRRAAGVGGGRHGGASPAVRRRAGARDRAVPARTTSPTGRPECST